jgi:hypothetical protein
MYLCVRSLENISREESGIPVSASLMPQESGEKRRISTCSGYSTGPGTDQHLTRVQHWSRYRSAPNPGTALVQVQISTCSGYSTGPGTD